MTYNPKIKNTSKDDMSIDANIDANNITMGEAEDGQWDDGIFAFTTETNVGTAIDKINELLKGLAPKVPSDLTNLSTTTPATDVRFADEITMEALSGRSKVLQLGSYTADPSTNFQRLGAYNSKEEISSITLTLNGDKPEDSQANPARTNLAADAFRVVAGKESTFKVYVNDQTTPKYKITVSQQGGVQDVAFLDNDGVALVEDITSISLTQVENGTFLSTGEEFALFQHRTGTVTIANNHFVDGFNYIKVTHQIEGESSEVETNFVEFICDKPTTRNNITAAQGQPVTFSALEKVSSDETIKNGVPKYLSGIAYYPGVDDCYYLLQGSVGNFTSTIYSNKANGGIRKSSVSRPIQGGALLAVSHQFDNRAYVNDPNSDVGGIKFTENEYHFDRFGQPVKVSIPLNSRILNDSPDVTITLENVFENDFERGQGSFNYGENIMFDNFAATSTDLIEEFNDENYRIDPTSDRDSITSWDSEKLLTTGDLVVQGGVLKSISQASQVNSPVQDYLLPTVVQEDAYYYRKFVNSNAIATGKFKIKTGADLRLAKRNDNEYYLIDNTIGNDAVEIHILDGSNSWKSILSTDGIYAQNKGVPTLNSDEFEIGFDLGTSTIPSPATLVMRIKTKQNLKGFIERIEVIPE